jgi:hypothetical protein
MWMVYVHLLGMPAEIRWWQYEHCFKELHKTIPNFQVFTLEREYTVAHKGKQPDTSLQI